MTLDKFVTILSDIAAEQGIELTTIPQSESLRIRKLSARKFSAKESELLTTETLTNYAKLTRPDSWEIIAKFGWKGSVILFTNPRDSMVMFQLQSMAKAVQLLAEAPPFDFYLMNPACTFLFAHDEYDNLYGCGTARAFVEINNVNQHGAL